ncbi:hypothetical protein THAOC_35939, partial [Thalassiosira oceanica]
RRFGLAADGVHDDPRGDEGDDARLADVGQSKGQDGRDSEQEAQSLDERVFASASHGSRFSSPSATVAFFFSALSLSVVLFDRALKFRSVTFAPSRRQ